MVKPKQIPGKMYDASDIIKTKILKMIICLYLQKSNIFVIVSGRQLNIFNQHAGV